MAGVAKILKKEYPEATEEECVRFVNACQTGKKDAERLRLEAEKLLEEYLDFRNVYGLDNNDNDNNNNEKKEGSDTVAVAAETSTTDDTNEKKDKDDDDLLSFDESKLKTEEKDDKDVDDGNNLISFDESGNEKKEAGDEKEGTDGRDGTQNNDAATGTVPDPSYYYDDTDAEADVDDAADWHNAMKRAITITESIKNAKEMEKKLKADEAAAAKKKKQEEEKPSLFNYDFEALFRAEEQQQQQKEEQEEKEGEGYKDDVATTTNQEDSKAKEDDENLKFDQIIFLQKDKDGKTTIRDRKKCRIFHVIPALIDMKRATAHIYGLALAYYLDKKLSRTSMEKVCIYLDVRSGEGWPNPPALYMINFIRIITNFLQPKFPERLETLLVSPVPLAAMGIFKAIQVAFRFGIMDKIHLITGPAGTFSSLPKDQLSEYVDSDILDLTEELRIDQFVTDQ